MTIYLSFVDKESLDEGRGANAVVVVGGGATFLRS